MKSIKKLFVIITVLCLLGALAACYTEPTGGSLLTVDASGIGDAPVREERSFRVGGYTFVYYNVYRSEDGGFVICDGGYIETVGGAPDQLMRFSWHPDVCVYGISEGVDPLAPSAVIVGDDIGNGQYRYVIAGYPDVRIKYNTPPGHESAGEANIGVICFWC